MVGSSCLPVLFLLCARCKWAGRAPARSLAVAGGVKSHVHPCSHAVAHRAITGGIYLPAPYIVAASGARKWLLFARALLGGGRRRKC
eukprot:491829-Pyramimonas_sp.AAC.1